MTAVIDVLRSIPLFAEVPDDMLEDLVAGSRQRAFRRGQVIFNTGDPGDSLAIVLEGRVKIAVRSADGGELTLTLMGPGGAIGELSVADGGDRSADVEALTDTRLLLIPRDAVQRLSSQVPSVAQAMLLTLAASLRRLTDATSDLVFLDLPRRVAKLLLSQAPGSDGTVDLGMSQEELAHRVGGTRQSVNAALRGFERRGWIALVDRRLLVSDQESLRRFAAG